MNAPPPRSCTRWIPVPVPRALGERASDRSIARRQDRFLERGTTTRGAIDIAASTRTQKRTQKPRPVVRVPRRESDFRQFLRRRNVKLGPQCGRFESINVAGLVARDSRLERNSAWVVDHDPDPVTRALDRDDEQRRCIIDDGLWAAACNRARARARAKYQRSRITCACIGAY